MAVARVIYISNDIFSDTSITNRAYDYRRLRDPEPGQKLRDDSFHEDEESDGENKIIINDFYAGKAIKKKTQMDDPENSMILLRYQ